MQVLTKGLVAVVKTNNKELVKLLLVHGAEMHSADTVRSAVVCSNDGIIVICIMDTQNGAFFPAAKDGHTTMIDLMIDYGVNINLCDSVRTIWQNLIVRGSHTICLDRPGSRL